MTNDDALLKLVDNWTPASHYLATEDLLKRCKDRIEFLQFRVNVERSRATELSIRHDSAVQGSKLSREKVAEAVTAMKSAQAFMVAMYLGVSLKPLHVLKEVAMDDFEIELSDSDLEKHSVEIKAGFDVGSEAIRAYRGA